MLYPLKYFACGDGVRLADSRDRERTAFINLSFIESVSAPIPFNADLSKRYVEVKMTASSRNYYISEGEGIKIVTTIGVAE